MKKVIHGFTSDEISDLYHYLCIYESRLSQANNLNEFKTIFPKYQKLIDLMSTFTCNKCNREELKIVGIAPLDNLVSMTWCKSSKLQSFLHHLRNSIAHAQIEQENGFVSIIDYGFENNEKVFSARGKIKSTTLFRIIRTITNNNL